MSVYIEEKHAAALTEVCGLLRKTIADVRGNAGEVVEVLIAGDFNRHDQLWGGDNISLTRQEEANEVIELMNDLSLSSLLPPGKLHGKAGADMRAQSI